jgi:hypothetical protein
MSALQVYVAGRLADMERVRTVQAIVRAVGARITFDWTGPEGDQRSDWSAESERAAELSLRERRAVVDADLLVLCGPDPHGGLGCFIEAGMALGRGIPVIVLEPVRESVFWYLPGVRRCKHAVEFGRVIQNQVTVKASRMTAIAEMYPTWTVAQLDMEMERIREEYRDRSCS